MSLIHVSLALLIAASASTPGTAVAPVVRKIYVTVSDGKGAPVTDLTAADFSIKEGGKEREIAKAERASTRMRLALLVEERLIGDGAVRNGAFEFMKRMVPSADIALITVGLRNNTVVDYTADLNAFVAGINGMTLNPPPSSNLTEGILDLAKDIEKAKPERPVIVAVAVSGGQAGGASSNEVLNQLRQSAATMYSVTLVSGQASSSQPGALGDESNREQVLGDGAKQTGGRRLETVATTAVPKALQQVADDLALQYVIEYTLPDGTKPDKRVNVTVKRKGVSLRAPAGLPDR